MKLPPGKRCRCGRTNSNGQRGDGRRWRGKPRISPEWLRSMRRQKGRGDFAAPVRIGRWPTNMACRYCRAFLTMIPVTPRHPGKGILTGHSILVDASSMGCLLDGSKTQVRHIATSALSKCRVGDRVWIKEACIAGRTDRSTGRDVSATLRNAQFVVFHDGWRQYRDGRRRTGAPPNNAALIWCPAIHMPRWASRADLLIKSVRTEHLQQISREDILASGLRSLAGLIWRWRTPISGFWRSPEHAYRARWNMTHGTPGERWEDDPAVLAIDFQVAKNAGEHRTAMASS